MKKVLLIESIKVTKDFLQLSVEEIGTVVFPAVDHSDVVALNKLANNSLISSKELLALGEVSQLKIPARVLFE